MKQSITSKLFKSFFLNFKSNNQFSSILPKSQIKGNLYTWGRIGAGLGLPLESSNNDQVNLLNPNKLSQFNNNVVQVSMGQYHTAVITSEGELYTFGYGKYGALGNRSDSSSYEPEKNLFFQNQGLKVTQVACGNQSTVAVTEDGQLWTWGYGGSKYTEDVGALGLGSYNSQSTPEKVQLVQNVEQLTSGSQFVTVVSNNGDIYNFGKGDYGSFGDPFAQNLLSPKLNENFKNLKEKSNLKVVKVKAAGLHQLVLLSDGNLYAMGKNNDGQCGTRENVTISTDLVLWVPTPVVTRHYQGQKIVDFDVGENTLVILTDKNQVFYSGLELAYQPIQFEIPSDKKIKIVSAGKDSIFVVTEDNVVYSNFEEAIQTNSQDFATTSFITNNSVFGGGNILELGGAYNTYYAIVKN